MSLKYDELIKRLRSQCRGYGKECEDCNADGNCRSQMENEAADAIEALEIKAETFKSAYIAEHNARIDEIKRNMWIPVTERLPEEDGKYLCTVRSFSQYNNEQYRFVDILVFQDGCFFECGIGTERVTHWMPLPEPPESEGE